MRLLIGVILLSWNLSSGIASSSGDATLPCLGALDRYEIDLMFVRTMHEAGTIMPVDFVELAMGRMALPMYCSREELQRFEKSVAHKILAKPE